MRIFITTKSNEYYQASQNIYKINEVVEPASFLYKEANKLILLQNGRLDKQNSASENIFDLEELKFYRTLLLEQFSSLNFEFM